MHSCRVVHVCVVAVHYICTCGLGESLSLGVTECQLCKLCFINSTSWKPLSICACKLPNNPTFSSFLQGLFQISELVYVTHYYAQLSSFVRTKWKPSHYFFTHYLIFRGSPFHIVHDNRTVNILFTVYFGSHCLSLSLCYVCTVRKAPAVGRLLVVIMEGFNLSPKSNGRTHLHKGHFMHDIVHVTHMKHAHQSSRCQLLVQ